MKRQTRTWVAMFAGCLVTTGLVSSLSAATIVKEGVAIAWIAIPDNANATEKAAAQELVEHVKKITGAELAVRMIGVDGLGQSLSQAKQDRLTAIVLGRSASSVLEKTLQEKSVKDGGFVLKVAQNEIFIGGPADGTYNGTLELLEQLGVRWFMPGDLGTVIPQTKTLEVRDQLIAQSPSFASRWLQMPHKDWQTRVRCGGSTFVGAHGLPAPPFKDAPEMYALIKGQRSPRQHCLSNPKLLEYAIEKTKEARKKGRGPVIGMGPNDGRGFCECDECKKLDGGDYDPFSNDPSVTDRYVWFFNQVLEKVTPEYPDTKLAFYIYHTYMRPPVRYKPDPHIMGALAPIALDRVHGFSNPIAPEKSYARWLYQEWGKIMPELYDRGYWSNLACPGFPFIIVHRLRDEIPACHALGVKGWRVETFPNYGPQLPSMYVAAKLMWNHEADVDAIMNDFFEKFFGPASEPMGKYVTLMDAALRDGDYCTGSAWDMPHFYPAALRDRARTLLAEGARQAKGHGIYEDRVRMIDETFQMLEAFIKMMEARAAGEFVAAQKQLEALDDVAARLMSYKPVPMVSAGRFSTYVNYMKRFYRPCTEQGYKRVTDGNQLVAMTKDEWSFQIDPARIGESIGLFRADVTGGNWQKLKTSSSSWSNQGLRYYKGLAWYRQAVDVPQEFRGKRLFLWCGGVDEKAKVWLNGKLIGISPGAAFTPFEMDATAAAEPGQRNVVTFCVANEVVNELGTGGIVAPVMLYAPAAGKDAKLENLRPLQETFP